MLQAAADGGESKGLAFGVRSSAGATPRPDERARFIARTELLRRQGQVRAEGFRLRQRVPSERSTSTQLLELSVKRKGPFLPHTDSWLLDGLDEDERKLASRILETCAAHPLPAGSRGRIGDRVQAKALLVESGFLVVRDSSPSGRQVVVAEAGAGSILLAPSEREHVQALTDSWVTVLLLAPLEALLALPGVATMLFRALETALRLRQDTTSYLANVRHIDRVRLKLLQLAEQFGRVSPDGIRLEFPLTHDLLAEMVGSARETVTRCLDELQRSGFVVRDAHSYRLLISPEALDAPG